MKIASYNVHKCKGIDGRFRPDRIIRVIAEIGADVMAVQEIDHRFGRRARAWTPPRSSGKPACRC